jgi:hypothetical protein
MPTIIRTPSGRRVQFEDGVSESRAFELARQSYPELFPDVVEEPKPAPAPAPKSRTFGEAATDLGASLATGIGGLAQIPSQLTGLVTGEMSPDKQFSPFGLVGIAGKKLEDYAKSIKSPYLLAQEEAQQKNIQEAYEKDGLIGEAGAAIKGVITNPALLTSFLAEQIPNFIGSLGAGAVAKIGVKTVAALSKGIINDVAGTAAKAGVRTAVASNAAMQGIDIGADTYQSVYDRLKEIQPNMPDEERNSIALSKARAAGASAAVISLGLNQLPGAKSIEKAVLGRTEKEILERAPKGFLRKVAEGFGGEALSEGIEEGPGGQLLTNVALQQVDPSQPLGKGVGSASAMGAITGGIFGGLSGPLEGSTPPKLEKNPSDQRLIALNQQY